MKFVNSASSPPIPPSAESVLQSKPQAWLGYTVPHQDWKKALQTRMCYLRK
jgi:hypothetical protein